ncbi:hypothetical protein PFICI_05033 [Pestalotiopsis fici W106-1]|uniref:Prp 4 CRoW domain-containing protein n=1 Tax=Pestalotiopsis fici (strain W106-1 / CGMCC3.15140) TaxID=1229662 RepID=W3XCI6_PESFW|nr:uncharacterized protein PFICI_05033 [Pestalotiopsis fici W106-1]ETS83157.1 hypothetical protein PFICI_05033 [Pestalotiopsis fici W106-1]
MLFSAIAFAALAGQAVVAEGVKKPYKPQMAKMSVKDVLMGRQAGAGYYPDSTACGTGDTCAEACGAGYEQCYSTDDLIHCYDLANAQTCCPNSSGDSCNAGYYCTADSVGETYCCPEGTSTDDCAASYGVTGGLQSMSVVATSTYTATLTSTTTVASTSSALSEAAVTTMTTASAASTTGECTTYTSEIIYTETDPTGGCTTYTSAVVHTMHSASATVGSNTTAIATTGLLPTSTTTGIPVQAGASALQVSGVVAAAVAALIPLLI